MPRPLTNAWVARLEVDAHWPGTRVVVELDSVRFHTSRAAFERDREKGNALVAAGYTVLRVTWRQLTQAPERVAETLARALALPAR
jgi:very-short-patch-repair endonuclease